MQQAASEEAAMVASQDLTGGLHRHNDSLRADHLGLWLQQNEGLFLCQLRRSSHRRAFLDQDGAIRDSSADA